MSIVHLTIPAQFRLSPALARAMHTEVWGPPRRMCWFIKPTSRTLRRKRPTFNATFGVGGSIRAPARENGSSRKARWSARKNPARFESALVAWPRRSAPVGRRRPTTVAGPAVARRCPAQAANRSTDSRWPAALTGSSLPWPVSRARARLHLPPNLSRESGQGAAEVS